MWRFEQVYIYLTLTDGGGGGGGVRGNGGKPLVIFRGFAPVSTYIIKYMYVTVLLGMH